METSTIIAHFYVPGMLSIMTSAVSIDEAMSPMIAQRFRRWKTKGSVNMSVTTVCFNVFEKMNSNKLRKEHIGDFEG